MAVLSFKSTKVARRKIIRIAYSALNVLRKLNTRVITMVPARKNIAGLFGN